MNNTIKDLFGRIDHNIAKTGDDRRDFVNLKLFPYLHDFKQKASGPNTIEYKFGEIFDEIKNRIQSGYNLREIIDQIDELRFRSQTEKYELSHRYEAKIKNMGKARRNGGEAITHRSPQEIMDEIAALDELKKSLLHQVFTGQLLPPLRLGRDG